MFLQIQHCVHKQFLHSHVAFLAGTLIAAGLLLPWLASCSHFCTLLFLCCFGCFWSSWTFINEAGGQPHSQGSMWLSVLLKGQLAGRCTRVLSASALLSSKLATSVAGDVLHLGAEHIGIAVSWWSIALGAVRVRTLSLRSCGSQRFGDNCLRASYTGSMAALSLRHFLESVEEGRDHEYALPCAHEFRARGGDRALQVH